LELTNATQDLEILGTELDEIKNKRIKAEVEVDIT
jgi:hypothetical protein